MKNRVFILLASLFIALCSFSAPVQRALGSVAVSASAAQAAVPSSNYKSGTYYSKSGFYVTLSAPKGTDIYYSINGGAYKLYSTKIAVTRNTTLKYYAQKNGVKSAVTTRNYKLAVKTVISHESGSYSGAQTVTITSPAKNVKFYYTLDGSKPTTSSALYNGRSIRISSSCNLRVLAYKKNWTNYVYTRDYKIDRAEQTKQESLLENYKAKYAYSTLTPLQKTLYSLIYEGVKEHKVKIDLSSYSVTVDDINTAFYAMDSENPQFFWLASGYSYSYSGNRVLSISPKYARTKSEAKTISPKLTSAVDKIAAAAAKKSSTFDKILYVHDAIVNATAYTTQGGEYKRDADGPLVNGKALCEGYAKAFAYICQTLGYDTVCVSGKGNGGDHMWNMIKLDGKWYYMDVTFDDPVSSVPICSYDFFCITEKQLLETHSIDNVFPLPPATATKYNYYNGAGITYHTNAASAYNELIRTAAQNYSKGVYTTEIYADEKIMTELMGKVKSDVFTSLGKYSCKPKGASYGYQGSKFYLTLS